MKKFYYKSRCFIFNDYGKILMVEQESFDKEKQEIVKRWTFPGGKLYIEKNLDELSEEDKVNLRNRCIFKTKQKTGLDIELVGEPYINQYHRYTRMFLGKYVGGELFSVDSLPEGITNLEYKTIRDGKEFYINEKLIKGFLKQLITIMRIEIQEKIDEFREQGIIDEFINAQIESIYLRGEYIYFSNIMKLYLKIKNHDVIKGIYRIRDYIYDFIRDEQE